MNTAFVIGNGTSRTGFDLLRLKPFGTVFGCNALYRQYYPDYELPDYLVAIDEGIMREIEASDFPSKRVIFPPIDERWEPAACNQGRPRSNAGMNAMREAIKLDFDQLICLGFDFLIADPAASVSNLFHGTDNYGPETRASANDNPGRVRYLQWLVNQHPEVDFIFIFDADEGVTAIKGPNVFLNTYENLQQFTTQLVDAQ